MNFSVRQWAILAALATAFLVAAWVLRGDDTDSGPATIAGGAFDEVAWCASTNPISRWGDVLDGEVDRGTVDDVVNLEVALRAAVAEAPADLVDDLRRLVDFAMLVQLEADTEVDLATAVTAARSNTDPDRVDAAVGRLDAEIVDCGHPSLVG